MINITKLFIPLIFAFSCSKKPSHCQLANETINEFILNSKEKYNVQIFGKGGRYMHQVDGVKLVFQIEEPLTIEKSRALILNLRKELLNDINNNLKLRPYLSHYPFSDDGIEISINSLNIKKMPDLNCEVSSVYTTEGKIIYYKSNEKYHNTVICRENIEDLLTH